jgi:hypothetical protein
MNLNGLTSLRCGLGGQKQLTVMMAIDGRLNAGNCSRRNETEKLNGEPIRENSFVTAIPIPSCEVANHRAEADTPIERASA